MGILARVRHLVAQELNSLIKPKSDQGADYRTNPVNPVLAGETCSNDTRSQTSGRIQTSTCVIDTTHLSDEEGEADAHGGDEGGAVLLGSKHEYGEDELEGQNSLDEHALREGHPIAQGGADAELGREHDLRQACSCDAAEKLRDEDEDSTDGRDGADENKG